MGCRSKGRQGRSVQVEWQAVCIFEREEELAGVFGKTTTIGNGVIIQ